MWILSPPTVANSRTCLARRAAWGTSNWPRRSGTPSDRPLKIRVTCPGGGIVLPSCLTRRVTNVWFVCPDVGPNGSMVKRAKIPAMARFLWRGLRSCTVILRQFDAVNGDRAISGDVCVGREIVATRPAPILRCAHQTSLHRIEMHVGQPVLKFLPMPHEAIPKLMLPNCSACCSRAIHSPGRKPFDVLQRARNRQWGRRRNQCVPMVGHHDVTQKLKAELRSRCVDARDQISVFARAKGCERPPQIHRDEENSIRISQAMYSRHAAMLRFLKAHGTKTVPWLPTDTKNTEKSAHAQKTSMGHPQNQQRKAHGTKTVPWLPAECESGPPARRRPKAAQGSARLDRVWATMGFRGRRRCAYEEFGIGPAWCEGRRK